MEVLREGAGRQLMHGGLCRALQKDAACLRPPGAPQEAPSPASPGLEAQPRCALPWAHAHPSACSLVELRAALLGPRDKEHPHPGVGRDALPCVTPRTHRLRRLPCCSLTSPTLPSRARMDPQDAEFGLTASQHQAGLRCFGLAEFQRLWKHSGSPRDSGTW